MKTDTIITEANQSEMVEILELLKAHHLPTKDIIDSNIDFFVLRIENKLVACGGIEKYGDQGLLRSVAVKEKSRGFGIGNLLVDDVLIKARESGITKLYLLTETAEHFFSRKGFKEITRDEAPEKIKASREFSELCSSTATLMKNSL